MILRFPNHEAAALAATRLRDEGYFAEIVDDSWTAPMTRITLLLAFLGIS